MRGEAVEAFFVGDDDFGVGVLYAIDEFRAGPPSVHADDRNSDTRAGPVGNHPFGVVPHCDRNTISGLNAVSEEPIRNRSGLFVGLVIGPSLVAVDEIFVVTVISCDVPDGPKSGRGVFVRP